VHPSVIAALYDANAQLQACPGLPDTDALRAASAAAPPHTPQCRQLAAPRACVPTAAGASLISTAMLLPGLAASLLCCPAAAAAPGNINYMHSRPICVQRSSAIAATHTALPRSTTVLIQPAAGTAALAVAPSCLAFVLQASEAACACSEHPNTKPQFKPMQRREARRHSVVLHQML
jgi:hypothetical protein